MAAAPSFADLFELYSLHTNGKEKVAEAIISIAQEINARLLLDLGAGDGRLTRLLSSAFRSTIAVEKHPAFQIKLAAITGVTVIAATIADYIPERSFDIALLSYSLSGVPLSELSKFLDRLNAYRSHRGKILFVTYRDGCPWDLFAEEIYQLLGIGRTGGLERHMNQLSNVGCSTESLQVIESRIWGESMQDLAANLGFFFYKRAPEYFDRLEIVCDILERYVIATSENRIFLPVSEVICEICHKGL